MELSSGLRLRSQVCPTEVIVVKSAGVDLTCGGHPMIPPAESLADGTTPLMIKDTKTLPSSD